MDNAFDFVYRVRKFRRKSVPKYRKKFTVKNFKVDVVHYPIVGTICILRQPLRDMLQIDFCFEPLFL